METSMDQPRTMRYTAYRIRCILCESTGELFGTPHAVKLIFQDFFTTRAVVCYLPTTDRIKLRSSSGQVKYPLYSLYLPP